MRVYIAGMITGLAPDEAEERFKNAENRLKALGYEPVNPYEEGKKLVDPTYEDYMQNGLKLLSTCKAIFLLDNWQFSKGAGLEEHYARLCHKHIFFEETVLPCLERKKK